MDLQLGVVTSSVHRLREGGRHSGVSSGQQDRAQFSGQTGRSPGFRAWRRQGKVMGLSSPCVPAAKPGWLSCSVSRWIAMARRISRSLGRFDGLWIALVRRAGGRRTGTGSSNRMRKFSMPGSVRAAHGGERSFRRVATMTGPPWAAAWYGSTRPGARCPEPTDRPSHSNGQSRHGRMLPVARRPRDTVER